MGYKMLHAGIKSVGFSNISVVALVLDEDKNQRIFFIGPATTQQLPEMPHSSWDPARDCIRVTGMDGYTYTFNQGGPYYYEPKVMKKTPLTVARLDLADIVFEVYPPRRRSGALLKYALAPAKLK